MSPHVDTQQVDWPQRWPVELLLLEVLLLQLEPLSDPLDAHSPPVEAVDLEVPRVKRLHLLLERRSRLRLEQHLTLYFE